jgi:hypothetical protein
LNFGGGELRKKFIVLAILLTGILSACVSEEFVPTQSPDETARLTPTLSDLGAQVGQNFTLGVGDTVSVEGNLLSVSLIEIVEDSRCPIGVQCFWEGNAKARVSVGEQEFILTIGKLLEGDQNAVDLGGGLILRLIHLNPYPDEGVDGQLYQATLVVERETSLPFNYPKNV